MLDIIKSRYILKLIFLNICNETKLKLIMKNKKLIDKLNVNLLDYKLLSGKYLIGKRNGRGKEYNSYNAQLIFKGEYIDGKRFGYGKEYKYNKIIFEGKYNNNKNTKQFFIFEFIILFKILFDIFHFYLPLL